MDQEKAYSLSAVWKEYEASGPLIACIEAAVYQSSLLGIMCVLAAGRRTLCLELLA